MGGKGAGLKERTRSNAIRDAPLKIFGFPYYRYIYIYIYYIGRHTIFVLGKIAFRIITSVDGFNAPLYTYNTRSTRLRLPSPKFRPRPLPSRERVVNGKSSSH